MYEVCSYVEVKKTPWHVQLCMKCTIIRDIYVVKFCKWQHEVTTIFYNLAAAISAAATAAFATTSAAPTKAAAGNKLSSFRFII